MAITPQAIKDQEFQIKFRGYDAVEVKAYLELIAEEFFELLEQVRQQFEEMDVIVAERDALQKKKAAMKREIVASRGSSEEIRSEFAERDSEVTKLRNELKKMNSQLVALEKENQKKEESLAKVEELMSKKMTVLCQRRRELINYPVGSMISPRKTRSYGKRNLISNPPLLLPRNLQMK